MHQRLVDLRVELVTFGSEGFETQSVDRALEGEDNDRVKAAVEKLNTTSAQLGQAMYAAAQAAQQQAPSEAGEPSEHAESNGESSASEEDVVDAEIVDDDQTSSEAR